MPGGKRHMSLFQAHPTSSSTRAPRLWIAETLVVLGVLAFGYFAVTLDGASWSGKPAAPASTDTLLEDLAR